MCKWVSLSYCIDKDTPSYGNGESLSVENVSSISKGDTANSVIWKIPNHLGTHIDFPKHFDNKGNRLSDYDVNFWICDHPVFIDVSTVSKGYILTPEDLGLDLVDRETDLLLIKTGFSKYRKSKDYWQYNPGFSPEIADFLRTELSNVKMIGFDSISLSSYTNRTLGREAHRSFLKNKKPILIIEDMDLTKLKAGTDLIEVIVSPLMIKDADGSPCSVLAKIQN